jgi:hypothetical protein
MTFRDEMTADVGAPQPRWEYLGRKLLEVMGIAFALLLASAAPGRWVLLLLIAGAAHTLLSQLLWWSRHPIDWWGNRGRGGVLGDTLYHGWIAFTPWMVAREFVAHGRLFALVTFLACLAVWRILHGMGFYVVRPG